MKLNLKRRFFGPQYTIGVLDIDGKYYCDTLEDTNRDINKNGVFDGNEVKIMKETCIPFGTYKIIVNMSNKFKRMLALLLNVPSFEGIRIHKGNTHLHTEGCILVGENKVKGQVINSAKYESELTKKIQEAIARGEEVSITIA